MNQKEIIHFFELLADRFGDKCRIILTGAAAGALYGRVRPTTDIDFALKIEAGSQQTYDRSWQAFTKAVEEVSATTGIAAQYAEDIDRWSSITLLDYEKHTTLFKRFGRIGVYLLEPSYWAIGKLSRYLDPDIQDLILVFKRTRTSWEDLCEVTGKALKESPKSTSCFQFRKQVEDFLKAHGKKVWGKNFNPEEAIKRFHFYAGTKPGLYPL